MNYNRYVVANILGAALWCSVTVLLGYFVGSFEVIQDYVTFVFDPVLLVTAITIIYAVVKLVRAREKNGKTPA